MAAADHRQHQRAIGSRVAVTARAGQKLDDALVELSEHDPVEDYAALTAVLTPLRAKGARLAIDDHVEVEGALRRRFCRTGAGVASRYEVEARLLRRRAAPAG